MIPSQDIQFIKLANLFDIDTNFFSNIASLIL